ncbi:hypothetical protein HMH01_02020 [Halovulum dunhuangense]|uniref:Nickel transport protein n=1 Tax=Halovulum dunhuangense TaxID=1505036 RepID=A0A849KZK1_9RHOB|nr:hypothetical protein [Halovulum dunhuangense]NNU79204.1 hypothetical protein [Halovulum dunhuangense]
MRRLLLSLPLMLALALPATAHRLVVYAHVEGGEIVVEAKFSNGNPAKLGEIRVIDAAAAELAVLPLDDDGETRFAIPAGAGQGVTVEVRTDEGHDDYWILSPADLGVRQ